MSPSLRILRRNLTRFLLLPHPDPASALKIARMQAQLIRTRERLERDARRAFANSENCEHTP